MTLENAMVAYLRKPVMIAVTLLVLASASASEGSGCSGVSLLQLRSSKTSTSIGFQVGPQNERQKKIVDMMRHAWKGYSEHCFGQDELQPVDGSCGNTWHLGLTLIDSLDTLYLMGLKTEFKAARNWVANRTALNFDEVGSVSLFETTIRVLGGLLGAHALSGDKVFLERAHELGDHLLPAFQTAGGTFRPPTTDVDLRAGQGEAARDPGIAESTSLALEFKTLTELTGISKYAEAVESVGKAIHQAPKFHGLAPSTIGSWDGELYGAFKIGASGDSYYEYLLKQWLLTGRTGDSVYLEDYKEAMSGIRRYLVKNTKGPLHLTYVAEMTHGRGGQEDRVERRMDHLVCFLPGTLALGAHYGVDAASSKPWHLSLAKDLMRTCYEMYKTNGHMLGPEIAQFDTDGQEVFVATSDNHDLLRPETVESLFYLYRLTGDKKYQDWGWEMAQAIEKYAKVKGGGYTSLDFIQGPKAPEKRNHMESFFSAETLKYLFLLFDDSRTQLPLDSFVLNTEAHPFHIVRGKNSKAEVSRSSIM